MEFGLLSEGGCKETTESRFVVAVNKMPSRLPLLCAKFRGVSFTTLSVVQRTQCRIVGRLPNDLAGKKICRDVIGVIL